MADKLYVNEDGSLRELGLQPAPEFAQRIEALEQQNVAQGEAISAAQSSADDANAGLVGVVRSVNGVNADAAGNVSDVAKHGDGYIRFTNGLQICWGSVNVEGRSYAGVTFPAAFVSTPSVVSQPVGLNVGRTIAHTTGDISTTSFTVQQWRDGSADDYCNGYWIAVGKWK